ncbi:response regulator [Marinobacterium sp. AK62]|uniref:histidine kinase n=2 Tax=Marinobacterium alkalitolerans TaxID=1542925 RepID=A0ABS3ZA77_9GAMM|nr:response regulator [Marinobacterium alkalitolerans]
MRSLSIRSRVLLLALIPMLVLAAILGSYFTYTRLADSSERLEDRGQLIAGLLASAAEFGVISGNRYQLQILSQQTRRNHEEVRDILFYDDQFNLLYRSDTFPVNFSPESPPQQRDDALWQFLKPIYSSALLLESNPELVSHSLDPVQIGWVGVVLSTRTYSQARQAMLVSSLLLILLGLMVTAVVASRFGLGITRPVRALSQVVERLEAGQLDTRASTTRIAGELGLLARGINRMAARIQQSSRQQEEQVQKATRQLTTTLRHLERQNEELSEARQQAESANRTKDAFLARMSHELRTPLTSVLGFARLLEETRQTPEQQQYCHIINQTSNLLLTIIDDILDFSRLQSNALKLEQIPFPVHDCLQSVIDMQAPMARDKGLLLSLELETGLPEGLKGDPTRLSQILTNLVSNAIKFTERGEVRMHAQGQCQGDECRLRVEVTDTGIGISPEHQQTLFKAFSQADNSISRRYGGSGLGLVIAHHLAHLMGGTLSLTSTPGEGTRVVLEVTLPKATPEEALPLPSSTRRYRHRYQLPRPVRILLAEDNEFNRLLLQRVLSHAGAEVIQAHTGTEAVEAFRQQRPDLVLMDVHMPEMDGIQATREIRRLDTEVPLFAVTANVMQHEHDALRAAGANEIMLKPLNLSRLFEYLHQLFDTPTPLAKTTDSALLDAVDPQALQVELNSQVEAVEDAVEAGDFDRIRAHAHQLMGLAGLYQLPELEAAVAELHQAAVDQDVRGCWQASHHLTRLVTHEQYRPD